MMHASCGILVYSYTDPLSIHQI